MLRIVRETEFELTLSPQYGAQQLKESLINARDYAREQSKIQVIENQVISVVDENERPFVDLQYVKNSHNHPEVQTCNYDLWDYDYDDIDNLDFTFLDQFQEFYFLEIEEYSFYIIEMILRKFPNKKIICADKIATCLWDNVKYIPSFPRTTPQKACLVYSHKYNGEFRVPTYWGQKMLDNESYICSSYHLMLTLLWMRKKERLGEKNKNKTVFIIDFESDDKGLIDIVRMTLSLILYAQSRNWTPVVHISRLKNQYLLKEGDNMWEYFFEAPSRITYEEAVQSYNVVQTATNMLNMEDLYINPILFKYDRLVCDGLYYSELSAVKSVFRINYDTMNFIRSVLPDKFFKNPVLGVVCRGTDYSDAANAKVRKGRKINANVNSMISASEKYAKKHNCEYIFLATEDEACFRAFKEHFGKRLLFVRQKRVSYDYKNNDYKPVADLLNIKDGKTFGRTYLASIYALSNSKALISSMYCGAFIGARMLCERTFEDIEIIG